jgi:hypothetical protein
LLPSQTGNVLIANENLNQSNRETSAGTRQSKLRQRREFQGKEELSQTLREETSVIRQNFTSNQLRMFKSTGSL